MVLFSRVRPSGFKEQTEKKKNSTLHKVLRGHRKKFRLKENYCLPSENVPEPLGSHRDTWFLESSLKQNKCRRFLLKDRDSRNIRSSKLMTQTIK